MKRLLFTIIQNLRLIIAVLAAVFITLWMSEKGYTPAREYQIKRLQEQIDSLKSMWRLDSAREAFRRKDKIPYVVKGDSNWVDLTE